MAAKRRYFIAEGPDAEALKKEVLDKIQAQHDQRQALQEKYGADATFTYRNGTVCGLAYLEADGKTREIPEGLKLDARRADGDKTYCVYGPNKRFSAGKKIDREFKAIKPFDGSEHIIQHFNASRWIPQSDGGSRTGMSMAVSAAGIIKGQVFLSVPVHSGESFGDDEPFTPPPCLRELKKSEFIALTEE